MKTESHALIESEPTTCFILASKTSLGSSPKAKGPISNGTTLCELNIGSQTLLD